MIALLIVLAQTAPTTTAPTGGGSIFQGPFIPIALGLVVFWFIISRGRNKERQKYEDMLSALKRNDRVQTIGGVLGTVVDVRDDEVVLKVDETNNVKMRFQRAAIKEILHESAAVGEEVKS